MKNIFFIMFLFLLISTNALAVEVGCSYRVEIATGGQKVIPSGTFSWDSIDIGCDLSATTTGSLDNPNNVDVDIGTRAYYDCTESGWIQTSLPADITWGMPQFPYTGYYFSGSGSDSAIDVILQLPSCVGVPDPEADTCLERILSCSDRCTDTIYPYICNDDPPLTAPDEPNGPCLCVGETSDFPVYKYDESTGETTVNGNPVSDLYDSGDGIVSNTAAINENIALQTGNLISTTETLINNNITNTTSITNSLSEINTSISNQSLEVDLFGVESRLDLIYSNTTDGVNLIDEGFIEGLVNTLNSWITSDTEAAKLEIENAVNDASLIPPMDELVVTSMYSKLFGFIPAESTCQPLVIEIPQTTLTLDIGCDENDKLKQFLGFIFAITTMLAVVNLIWSEVSPSKIN